MGGAFFAVVKGMSLGEAERVGGGQDEKIWLGLIVVPLVERAGECRLQKILVAHAGIEDPELCDEQSVDCRSLVGTDPDRFVHRRASSFRAWRSRAMTRRAVSSVFSIFGS